MESHANHEVFDQLSLFRRKTVIKLFDFGGVYVVLRFAVSFSLLGRRR